MVNWQVAGFLEHQGNAPYPTDDECKLKLQQIRAANPILMCPHADHKVKMDGNDFGYMGRDYKYYKCHVCGRNGGQFKLKVVADPNGGPLYKVLWNGISCPGATDAAATENAVATETEHEVATDVVLDLKAQWKAHKAAVRELPREVRDIYYIVALDDILPNAKRGQDRKTVLEDLKALKDICCFVLEA